MAGQHYNGYEAFKLYMGVRQHFKTEGYDIFRMRGRFKFPKGKFDERNDAGLFHRLAYEYYKGDLANFFMANILAGKEHPSEMTDITFREWKSRIHRIDYIFESDCKVMQNLNVSFRDQTYSISGGLPIILQLLHGNHIHLETVCIMNSLTDGNILMLFDEQITDKLLWPDLRNRIVKYTPWLKIETNELKIACY